jgi:hypothetical protein
MRTVLPFLVACTATELPSPPPPTIVFDGDDRVLAEPAARPTVAVRGDHWLVGYQYGSGLAALPAVTLLDASRQPLAQHVELDGRAGNHVQVLARPGGWKAAWVRTGVHVIDQVDLDADAVPLGAAFPLAPRTAMRMYEYPDLALGGQQRWLSVWSEQNRLGEVDYTLTSHVARQPQATHRQVPPVPLKGGPPTVCVAGDQALMGWQHKATGNSAIGVRLTDLDAAPLGPPVWLDFNDTHALTRPACVGDPGLGWAVAWRAMDRRGTHHGTFLRFLDPDAQPLGPTIVVDPEGEGVAMALDGDDLVLAWRDYDSDQSGVALQVWSMATRSARTPITRVNSLEAGIQGSVDVDVWRDAAGLHGVVAWHDRTDPSWSVVLARGFDLL